MFGDRHTHIHKHTDREIDTHMYGIVEFNVPLDTVQVISETTTLSSDVHLSFSNGGPTT